MNKGLLFLFLICFNHFLYSQENNNIGINLKLHPLPLIGFDVHRIQGSIELIYKRKIGVDIGYGQRYYDPNFFFKETYVAVKTINPSGNIKMIDVNLYNLFTLFSKKPRNAQIDNYIGFSIRQIQEIENAKKDYTPANSNIWKTDYFAREKTVFVFALKMGIVIEYRRFAAEGFVESGMRHINQSLIGVNPDNGFFESEEQFFLWFNGGDFVGYVPHINAGLKIYFKILK